MIHRAVLSICCLMVTVGVEAKPISQSALPTVEFEFPTELQQLPPDALKLYEAELAQRIVAEGEHPRLLHELGRLLYRQGRKEEAMRVWQRAAEEEPNMPAPELTMDAEELFLMLERKETQAAAQKLEDIEAKYADSPHFHLLRAEQAMRSNNLDAAEQSYRKAHELNPQLYVTSLNLARYYDIRQRHQQARTYYQKAVELGPDCGICWQYLGAHQFKQGKADLALESFRRAAQADPLQPSAEIRLAVLSLDIGDAIGARRWFRAELDGGSESEVAVRAALTNVLLRLGLLEEAKTHIEAILDRQTQLPLVTTLASIHETQGNVSAAEHLYRRALELAPGNMVVNNNLAMLLMRQDRSSDEALELAESAYKEAPDNPLVFGTRACALYHAGKDDEAGRALSAAVRINPDDAWARFCYANLLLKQDQKQDARVHLEAVLILDPEFPRRQETERLLTQLD